MSSMAMLLHVRSVHPGNVLIPRLQKGAYSRLSKNKICFTERPQYLPKPNHSNGVTVSQQPQIAGRLSLCHNPEVTCVAGFHVKSGYSDTAKSRSKYGKILRRSRVFRGERKRGVKPVSDTVPSGRPIQTEFSGKPQDILKWTSIAGTYSDTTKLAKDQFPSSIHFQNYQEPASVVNNIESESQHIFDEEYFADVVTALTGSEALSSDGGASVDEIAEKELFNQFDHQYFERITRLLTHQTSTQNDNSESVRHENNNIQNVSLKGRDRNKLYAKSIKEIEKGDNVFDQHYFGEVDFSSKGSLIDEIEKQPTDIKHNSAHEWVKKMVGTPNSPTVNHHFPVQEDEKLHFKLNAENKKVLKPTIDTSQSEFDFFKQEFLRKETINRVTSNQHSAFREQLQKKEFSPAEKVSKFAATNISPSEDVNSYLQSHSKIDISHEDKMQLEARRESVERATKIRVGGGGIDDLEPEVGAVILASKKKKVFDKPKLKREVKFTGTPDPTFPVSEHNCSGCGATLHCQEQMKPGYMPSEKFKPLAEANELSEAVCQRCWYFVHMKQALNVNVDADNYSKIIRTIQTRHADILLMVDMVDFPCSMIPNLKDMIGGKSRMIIVGNKVDLLPKDSPDYLKRMETVLLETCVQENVCDKEQVQNIHLVSAKTGYGIEDLITTMQRKWGGKNDVYLLGTANIGKSTLFNTLLNSDMSKTKAHYLIKKATISRWPGTTLNLLKFPIMKPTKEKLYKRNLRLEEERKAVSEKPHPTAFDKRQINLRAYVKGNVGKSFTLKMKADNSEDNDDSGEEQPPVSGSFEDPFNTMHPNINLNPRLPTAEDRKSKKKELPFTFNPEEFESGKWFYDTPGVLQNRQMLTHLTMEELKETMANKVIIPRTLILKPGQVIFLGGLGRLDYVQGVDSVYFTVFASEGIPVRYCGQEEADEYYNTHAGQHFFRVPIGGAERMKTFPKLLPVDFQVEGCGWQKSVSDILLSSAGWVSITAGRGMIVQLKAFTPNGHGCFTRQPALLPYAVNMKGHRLSKQKPFYHVDPKCVLKFM